MGARVYVPEIGRFLQTDPIPGGSANAYDYCNQDPVNCTDLDGDLAKKIVKKLKTIMAPLGVAGGLIASGAGPIWHQVYQYVNSNPDLSQQISTANTALKTLRIQYKILVQEKNDEIADGYENTRSGRADIEQTQDAENQVGADVSSDENDPSEPITPDGDGWIRR